MIWFIMDDVRWMKDYPYKMTVEQARAFGEDVLNIVAQIPHGRVTRVYLSSLMGMWICSIIFGNRRSGDEETPSVPLFRGKDGETPSVPLFRGKKCEASLGLPEGRRMM